jgi:hypothetical protein
MRTALYSLIDNQLKGELLKNKKLRREIQKVEPSFRLV